MISILVTKKGAGGGWGGGGITICAVLDQNSKWWQCYEVQQQSVLNLRNLN